MNAFQEKIEYYVNAGLNVFNSEDYLSWQARVVQFLKNTLGETKAKEFEALSSDSSWGSFPWKEFKDSQLGFLEALFVPPEFIPSQKKQPTFQPNLSCSSRRVFVVHGHDGEAKEATARLLEKIELEPIILHEQPNQGRTIIEKFEAHSGVGFAIVLLTPDDVGSSKTSPDELKPRARQNVILELGFFTGKLGRSRVCALYKPDVEIPSDFQGVLFIPLDPNGAWRLKLIQELIDAKLDLKIEGFLNRSE